MSRRTLRMTALAGSLLLCSALGGCSTATPSHTNSPGPAASHAPGAKNLPTPTPTPTFIVQKYTCTTILPPATLAVFQGKASAGFTLQADFTQRVHNYDPNLAQFDDFGGILCQWAYPEGGTPVDYGFSPITATQAATETSMLETNGYAPTHKDNGVVMSNTDTADYPDTYLFIDGYWFYASDADLLDLIVENVFSSGN